MELPAFRKLMTSAHVLFLFGLLALTCLPLTIPVKFPQQFWIKQGIDYLLWAGLFFLNLNVFVPRFLYRGKVGLFIIIVVVAQFVIVQLNKQIDMILHLPEQMRKTFATQKVAMEDTGIFIMVIITLVIFGISTIIAFAQKIREDRLREQILEKDRVSSELSFLKTQINPHFFFNVLHTIYGLIKTDSNTAQESVYSLSHMMRYVLYETRHDETTLAKEISFVEDYIKLMQLRLSKDVQIIFEKPKVVNDIIVAPMLFLPFVENAFKHGISTIHPSYIYIAINIENNTLNIEVRNSIFNEKADNLEESTGIGLVNTERRLKLIYPERHTLTVDRNEKTHEFTVNLKLIL